MYRILALQNGLSSSTSSPALVQDAAIGDKMPTYLIVRAGAAAVAVTKAGVGAPIFDVGIGESWLLGPIRGSDIGEWGLYSALAASDHTVAYLAGRLATDPRPATMSVHDAPPIQTSLDFVWRQLA